MTCSYQYFRVASRSDSTLLPRKSGPEDFVPGPLTGQGRAGWLNRFQLPAEDCSEAEYGR